MNYVLTLGIIAVVAATVGAVFYWYQQRSKQPASSLTLFEVMREESRVVQEKKLLAIKKAFKISNEAWDSYWNSFYQSVYADDLFEPVTYQVENNDPLHALFEEILLDYGINPQRVELGLIKNNPDYEQAQAIQLIDKDDRIVHKVEINYQIFEKNDSGAREVILRHEIMHLICYDALAISYLYEILQNAGYSKEQIINAPSVIAYNHEMELRADRLSLCMNRPLAECASNMYQWATQKIQKEELNDVNISHPTYKQRYQELKKLIKRMD